MLPLVLIVSTNIINIKLNSQVIKLILLLVDPPVNGHGDHLRLAALRSEVRAVAAASVATDRAELKVKITNMSKKTVAGTIRNAFLQYGELEAVDIVLDDNDLPSGSAVLLYR